MSWPSPHSQACKRELLCLTSPIPNQLLSAVTEFEIRPFPIRSLLWLWKLLSSGSLYEHLRRAQPIP